MSTLYLLKYNNYFNRTIKRESSIQAYLNVCTYSRKIDDINFFYNDQVNTTQTINWNNTPIQEAECDYLLVDNEHYGLSRWFIIENKWNRKGQQLLTLRRDLVVDFLDDIKDKDFFCEKGCLIDGISNKNIQGMMPLISNSENILVSQILKRKFALKPTSTYDNAIVGYMDRSFEGGALAPDEDAFYVDTIEELPIGKYYGVNLYGDIVTYHLKNGYKTSNTDSAVTSGYYITANINSNGYCTGTSTPEAVANFWRFGDNPIWSYEGNTIDQARTKLKNAFNATGTAEQIAEVCSRQVNNAGYTEVKDYIGKYVVMNGKLYTIQWENLPSEYLNISFDEVDCYNILRTTMQEAGFTTTYQPWDYHSYNVRFEWSLYATATAYRFQLVEESQQSVILLANQSNRNHTTQPYDIFYMPYSSTALKLASIISARYYASGILYDIQRLPYKPNTNGLTPVTYTLGGVTTDFYWIRDTDVEMTLTNNDYQISYGLVNQQRTAITEYKVGSLCDMCRIVSPNNANAWDFNPAQNGGVQSWFIRMTCKPYNPYIHIKPDFKWMYGDTWDEDPRGLICGGSFSLPLVSDKWAQYQLNNKAYYDSFNRDIENLSTVQDAQRINEKWQIAANAISASLNTAAQGMKFGVSPAVSAGFGVAAGIGTTIGGIADYEMNEKLRNEALDYKKDQFGFNCRNMIASPRTLARTDAFDIDWNEYPYVEFYTASNVEKEAIRNKLKYNGWTLNYTVQPNNTELFSSQDERGFKGLLNVAANTTVNHLPQSHYIKGKLIWTTGYNDTHIFNELANELYKGIYWEGGAVT